MLRQTLADTLANPTPEAVDGETQALRQAMPAA